MTKEQILDKLIEIQHIVWEDGGDTMGQDTYFKLQENLAILALDVANSIKKAELLLEEFPFIYHME